VSTFFIKMASSALSLLARRFSTASIRSQLVQPPLAVFGTEGRYATALYSAASKQKKIETVEQELKEFQKLLKTDKKLLEFVGNPMYNRQVKRDALVDILKKKKASDLTINTIAVLADNGRFNLIDGVCNSFGRIMSAYRGEVVCEIVSAKPLDDPLLKELTSSLQGFVKKGEVIIVKTKVDPSIIGGLVISIGDKYVDMSFANKIKTYTNIIKEAI